MIEQNKIIFCHQSKKSVAMLNDKNDDEEQEKEEEEEEYQAILVGYNGDTGINYKKWELSIMSPFVLKKLIKK